MGQREQFWADYARRSRENDMDSPGRSPFASNLAEVAADAGTPAPVQTGGDGAGMLVLLAIGWLGTLALNTWTVGYLAFGESALAGVAVLGGSIAYAALVVRWAVRFWRRSAGGTLRSAAIVAVVFAVAWVGHGLMMGVMLYGGAMAQVDRMMPE